MKKILALTFFLFVALTVVQAQANAWGNGNGQGNANGYAWGNGGGFNALVNLLESGGQIPQVVALAAISEAREWGWQTFRLNYGQMVAKFAQGQLTVSYISTAPPTLIFRVEYGGHGIIVILDSV